MVLCALRALQNVAASLARRPPSPRSLSLAWQPSSPRCSVLRRSSGATPSLFFGWPARARASTHALAPRGGSCRGRWPPKKYAVGKPPATPHLAIRATASRPVYRWPRQPCRCGWPVRVHLPQRCGSPPPPAFGSHADAPHPVRGWWLRLVSLAACSSPPAAVHARRLARRGAVSLSPRCACPPIMGGRAVGQRSFQIPPTLNSKFPPPRLHSRAKALRVFA